MLISYIIPTNELTYLNECILHIKNQKTTIPFEIIIVFNSNVLFEIYNLTPDPAVTTLVCTVIGPAAVRNLGARYAKGDFLAFIDCDTLIDDNWASTMIQSTKHYDIATSAIIPAKSKNESNYLFNYRLKLRKYNSNGTFITFLKNMYANNNILVNTAACFVRRSLFDQLNGFNQGLIKFEDLEFSARALRRGARFFFTNHTAAHVFYSGSTFSYIKRSYYNSYYLGHELSLSKFLQNNFLKGIPQLNPPEKILSIALKLAATMGFIYSKVVPTHLSISSSEPPGILTGYFKYICHYKNETYVFNPYSRILIFHVNQNLTTIIRMDKVEAIIEGDLLQNLNTSPEIIQDMINKKLLIKFSR